MSAPPPAKKTAGLIEKETHEHRTSNIEGMNFDELVKSQNFDFCSL
jgi:hypothetical protein